MTKQFFFLYSSLFVEQILYLKQINPQISDVIPETKTFNF